MQTAIQQIINKLEEQIVKSAHNKLGTNRTGDYRIGIRKAIDFCQEYLEMEKQKEYETKAYWFGRGILAGRENRIEELKPKQ